MIENILSDIQSKGFSVQENLFSKSDILALKDDILSMYHNNSMKDAGIGRGAELQKNIRGDQIFWLTKESLTSSQKVIWDFLETFKAHINQDLYLGLKDFETHVTVYPENTFYKKHIDQFQKNEITLTEKTRKISFILYLNEDWNESDGGELKLFDPKEQDQVIETILPKLGKAVFFLSEEFPHEVLETKKQRISMTGWFYR